MNIDFIQYVQYRGRQFEKMFKGKKKIIYITNHKDWVKIVPEDKEMVKERDGLSTQDGYIYINPKINDIQRLDSIILEEITHVYHWDWNERKTRKFVKDILGN